MILITGATGKLGTAVIAQLVKKVPANQIAALVRDGSKASALKELGVDIRLGSYDDEASLDKAMQGVGKVLLIAGTDEENRVRQHQNVVDAAKKAGVSCIAYTSRTLKDRSTMVNQLMEGHFQTEDLIKASGLPYLIFRNVLYLDSVLYFAGPQFAERGIHAPAGDGKVAYALRREMGEAIANVLAEGACDCRMYFLTGIESFSFNDIAAALSELTGKEVKYTPAEASVFAEQMKQRGLPEIAVKRGIDFMTDIKNGQEDEVSNDLEDLLGRKPIRLKEGLKEIFKL